VIFIITGGAAPALMPILSLNHKSLKNMMVVEHNGDLDRTQEWTIQRQTSSLLGRYEHQN